MLKKGEAMDVDTYVPGHGFVDPPEILREDLTEYRKAIEFVVAKAAAFTEGACQWRRRWSGPTGASTRPGR